MADLSLVPDEFNFIFWQGDTLNVQFTIVDENNLPVDLSGYTSIRGQVRDEFGEKAADLLIVESDLNNGIFETFLEQADSSTLVPETEYPYDIQLQGTKLIDAVSHKTINTIVHGYYTVWKESTLEVGVMAARNYQQVAPGEKPAYTVRRRWS